jgi:carbamoyl-phosphate synthase large subunit
MSEASEFNILISSAGRRVALLEGFRQSLGVLHVPGRVMAIDCSPLAAAFHRADRAFVVPRCVDPAFIPSVAEICRREGVSLIVPTIDPELPVYAARRAEIEAAGARVLVSSEAVVAICRDKVLTHRWLVDRGLPAVAQWEVGRVPTGQPLPLIAKPRFGSAAVGVRCITRAEDLEALPATGDMIVQAVATGIEFTVDVFVDQAGRCRCAVPRRRIEVRAGEVSKGVTVRNGDLEHLAMSVAEALPGARGVLNIQVFCEPETGEMRIIEINPRFGGGFPLARHAGADFTRWVIEEALGRECSARNDLWRSGVVMLRYDDAVFVTAEQVGLHL